MIDLTILSGSVLAIFVLVTFLYFISRIINRVDIIDIGWGIGFLIIAVLALIFSDKFYFKQIILLTMIFIWSMRLSIYLFLRIKQSSEEDHRYQEFRKSWKGNFKIQSYFKIFIFQGILILLISLPILIVNSSPSKTFNLIDFFGVSIWFIGFVIESISDYQLASFKKQKSNKGKIMNKGLWKFSRHPNYFGEILLWWGIFLLTLTNAGWYIALISPLLISYLIIKVSGIPLAEKSLKQKDGFKEYASKTSILIPLPNKL
jgi:steroid 5-alpha reductase family enzyme